MMIYPRPRWWLSFYDLVDIVYAIVQAIVMAIPVVAPPNPNAWYVPLMVFMGPSTAPLAPMEPIPMIIISIVCMLMFCFPCAIGFLVHYLGMVASGGTMNRAWACFAVLPFTMLLSLCLPEARTKFSKVVSPALIMAFCYVPVGFYMQDPYLEVGTMLLLALWLLAIACGVSIVWKLLHWIPYKGPEPPQVFAYTYADFFDILIGYFDSATDHPEVIKTTFDQFNEACMALAPCKKISPLESEVMWNMAGELLALYDCLNEHQFDRITRKVLWQPLASEVLDIRSAVGRVMRKTADGDPIRADMNIQEDIDALQKHAGEVSDTLRDCQALAGKELDRVQVTRFYYAIESILSIAVLAEKYRVLHVKADEAAKEKAEKNKQLSLCTKTAGLSKTIWSAIKGWLKRPLFDDLHGSSDLMSRMRVPLRTAFGMNILCTMLVLWGNYMLCLYLHPGNMAAFFVENILFVIIAKLGLKDKRVGYAAYVFYFTWSIIGWGSILVPMPESQQLQVALWRLVFTTGGVLLMLLSSCLIFPNFAATQLIEASKTSIESVAEDVAPLLLGGYLKDCEGEDQRLAALVENWQNFGREAYNQIASRINLKIDSAAEIAVYGRLHLVPELSKRVWREQKYITNIQRSGLVLFTSVIVLYPHAKDPQIQDLFRPATDIIIAFGKAVQASGTRMTEFLKTGVLSNVSAADDDLHVEVQRCLEAMHDLQDRIATEFLANPNRQGDPSAIMKLFHAAYALCDFATSWEELENALLGKRVPCEMAESLPNEGSSNPSQTVPTLRGRVPSSATTA
ncbi:hypothetical protein FOL47_008408 [Perkinsus chesapeaki]|uniref:Aluminum-activated malate transporter 1 n=1 Tax=Perkinsus chesapeaki TaxID=330153 RepID=A0A7J6LE19_PERCH|nr:hypothetical protein FOL47_008408 [Perkinsus chesapeaki]